MDNFDWLMLGSFTLFSLTLLAQAFYSLYRREPIGKWIKKIDSLEAADNQIKTLKGLQWMTAFCLPLILFVSWLEVTDSGKTLFFIVAAILMISTISNAQQIDTIRFIRELRLKEKQPPSE